MKRTLLLLAIGFSMSLCAGVAHDPPGHDPVPKTNVLKMQDQAVFTCSSFQILPSQELDHLVVTTDVAVVGVMPVSASCAIGSLSGSICDRFGVSYQWVRPPILQRLYSPPADIKLSDDRLCLKIEDPHTSARPPLLQRRC